MNHINLEERTEESIDFEKKKEIIKFNSTNI